MTRSPNRAGAVVTGAGQGLGKLLAALLIRRGYQVLVTDLDEQSAERTAAELGDQAWAMRLDVRDHDQVDAARDAVLQRVGRLDVWINNAGVLITGPAWQQSPEQRRLMVEVNALGTINGTVAAIDAMRENGGHIVNIVSLAGLTAVPGEAVYAASKHAAIGFSLSTLADLQLSGVENIDISCVCPDGIWTPMLHDKLDDPAAALSFSGKLLQPEDVVKAVDSLLNTPKPVVTIPYWRGVQVRIGDAFPRLGLKAYSMAIALGKRKQRAMLRTTRPSTGT